MTIIGRSYSTNTFFLTCHLIRLPHFPAPPPLPGHDELSPQVLFPRSLGLEIPDMMGLGLLRRQRLGQRGPLVNCPD